MSLPKRYKAASFLMIVHGGFMELGGGIAVLLMGVSAAVENSYVSFVVPYLQENLQLMLIMGCIFGVVRLIGAVGMLKNRMWGLALSIINCVVTMALMIFMLPAGVMDGILACSSLILMLSQFYGDKKIAE